MHPADRVHLGVQVEHRRLFGDLDSGVRQPYLARTAHADRAKADGGWPIASPVRSIRGGVGRRNGGKSRDSCEDVLEKADVRLAIDHVRELEALDPDVRELRRPFPVRQPPDRLLPVDDFAAEERKARPRVGLLQIAQRVKGGDGCACARGMAFGVERHGRQRLSHRREKADCQPRTVGHAAPVRDAAVLRSASLDFATSARTSAASGAELQCAASPAIDEMSCGDFSRSTGCRAASAS